MTTLYRLQGTPGAVIRTSWANVVVPVSGEVYVASEARAEELEGLGLERRELETIQTINPNPGPPLQVIQPDTTPELTRTTKKRTTRKSKGK